MILDFIRNKIVEVEPFPDGSLKTYWRLKDSIMDVEVELRVQTPDLEVKEAEAQIKFFAHKECLQAQDLIEKIVGIRVGPGLRKIVNGLIGGSEGCDVMIQAVLESSNALILHFTKYTLQPRDKLDEPDRIEAAKEALKANPRLAGSCVVFAEDSPVMQGMSK